MGLIQHKVLIVMVWPSQLPSDYVGLAVNERISGDIINTFGLFLALFGRRWVVLPLMDKR